MSETEEIGHYEVNKICKTEKYSAVLENVEYYPVI